MFDPLRQKDAKPGSDQPGWHIHIPERILGLNAPQRFIVAVILFLLTTVIGVLVLLATQKMVLF